MNGDHIDPHLAVLPRLRQLIEEFTCLCFCRKSSCLEPRTRLAAVGELDQPGDDRHLVAGRRSCTEYCHSPELSLNGVQWDILICRKVRGTQIGFPCFEFRTGGSVLAGCQRMAQRFYCRRP